MASPETETAPVTAPRGRRSVRQLERFLDEQITAAEALVEDRRRALVTAEAQLEALRSARALIERPS